MASPMPTVLLQSVRQTLQVHGFSFFVAVALLALVPPWLRWLFFYGVGFVFLTSLVVPRVEDYLPRSRVLPAGKAVFISGCDSGFGHSLAQQLDDAGLQVFAGCLLSEGEGAAALKKTASPRLHIVSLDVTSTNSVEKAADYVQKNLGDNKLWAVVNNAGLSDGGELLWTPMDCIEHTLEVNMFGVVRLTKAFLPTLLKNKGRVVTVCSAAGRYTYGGIVPYCMSKCAAVSFCEGLRLESYRFGLKVITIEPWMYKTPITDEVRSHQNIARIWEKASPETKELLPENYRERYAKRVNKFLNFSISDKPQQVVDCLIDAVLAVNPKYSYNPGTLYAKISHWVFSRLPKPIADYGLSKEFSVPID